MPTAIPAAIGLGAPLLGGAFGKGQQKKQQTLADQQRAQLQPLINEEIAGATERRGRQRQLAGQSLPLLQRGGRELTSLIDFWSPLLRGDRGATSAYIAPGAAAATQAYEGAVNAAARQGPRGGGRVSAIMQAERDKQNALTNLIFGARRDAAGQVQGIGQFLSQLGMGGFQSTLGDTGSPLGPLISQLAGQNQSAFQAGLQESAQSQKAFEGIGSVLRDVAAGKVAGKSTPSLPGASTFATGVASNQALGNLFRTLPAPSIGSSGTRLPDIGKLFGSINLGGIGR